MSRRVPAGNVRLKRAYEPPAVEDGTRILIDRLWPRGVSKAHADLDRWMKDISPTTELRTWFGHDPARWEEFRRRYTEEVRQNAELLEELRSLARRGPITLVYSAHDEAHNDAVVLRESATGTVKTGRPQGAGDGLQNTESLAGQCWTDIRLSEIPALVEQRHVPRAGEREGGAVAAIERRTVATLAKPEKGIPCEGRLLGIERNNLDPSPLDQRIESAPTLGAAPRPASTRRLMHADRRQTGDIRGDDRTEENVGFRFADAGWR